MFRKIIQYSNDEYKNLIIGSFAGIKQQLKLLIQQIESVQKNFQDENIDVVAQAFLVEKEIFSLGDNITGKFRDLKAVFSELAKHYLDYSMKLHESVLIQLDNRKGFLEFLQASIYMAIHLKFPFCCAVLKMDNYQKFLQDYTGLIKEYKHRPAEYILRETRKILQKELKYGDFLFHLEEDLFGVVLANVDKIKIAKNILSRLQGRLLKRQFNYKDHPIKLRFGLEYGITIWKKEFSAEELIARSETELKKEKN